MADAQFTGGAVRVLTEGNTAKVSGARVRALYNFPSAEGRVSEARVRSFNAGTAGHLRASQMRVRVLIRGRIENRRVRAWTYSLDGHDFYVLRLGETTTLQCDLMTGQWSVIKNGNRDTWRAVHGRNWTTIGGELLGTHLNKTNIVAGDDTWGILWLLNPEQGYDENPVDATEETFPRVAMGGVPMRMRQTARCNEVYVLGNKGASDLTLATPTISLRTSDDAERTWVDQGDITVAAGEWDQEFAWRSLGLIQAPGRVFAISDNFLARLDGLEFR